MTNAASQFTTHEITVLTFSSPIPTTASGTSALTESPFSNQPIYPTFSKPLDLSGATVGTLKVQDDDGEFRGFYYARTSPDGIDLNQVVAASFTFNHGTGSTTLNAGQQIGYDYSGRMFCVEDDKIVAAYEIAFPRTPGTVKTGDIVGAKYSMMVIPIPWKDSKDNVIPAKAFVPGKTYHYGNKVDYIGSNDSITYVDIDCFATGTLIDTPQGPRAVETFRAGDLVMTRDHGAQPLVWAGACRVDAAQLDLQPNLRPIRIAAGALGRGQPRRDLLLSPQHRVLVRSAIAERMFGSPEILVAAKHLVGLPGITVCAPAEGVGYHHLLFSGHEVVRSEGAWTESLFLGPRAMLGLDPAARREVMTLFPELAAIGTMPEPARRLLTWREGRTLAERHGRNGKPLLQDAAAVKRAEVDFLPA